MPTESLYPPISDDQQDMRVAYVGGMLMYFVAVLIAVGGRSLTFATVFGSRVVLIGGSGLALAAYPLVATTGSPWLSAFTDAGFEAAFAILLFVNARRPSLAYSLRA